MVKTRAIAYPNWEGMTFRMIRSALVVVADCLKIFATGCLALLSSANYITEVSTKLTVHKGYVGLVVSEIVKSAGSGVLR